MGMKKFSKEYFVEQGRLGGLTKSKRKAIAAKKNGASRWLGKNKKKKEVK